MNKEESKEYERKKVVALTYRPDAGAPKVIAKGQGLIAERILATAKEHEVPIQEDPSLVQMLSKLDINEAIPEQLYQAVAEVFAFLYRIERNMKKK